MYGTRSAAAGWQEKYSTTLIKLGFVQGLDVSSVFRHEDRQIMCTVHGGDFTSFGPAEELDWVNIVLDKEYEVSLGSRLWPGPDDSKEAHALNRNITWHEDCIEYEVPPPSDRAARRRVRLSNYLSILGVKKSFQEHEADATL